LLKKIAYLTNYAITFLGQPYKWGGNNPLEGYDCSGFIQEVLASIGYDPPCDQTAQTLFNYFYKDDLVSEPKAGAIAFYGHGQDKIRHVALCLNDFQIIEAAGGNSETRTIKDAARDDAFIRVRPVMHRRDFINCLFFID
jgi:cell wall-associated NlpC family hydrolase